MPWEWTRAETEAPERSGASSLAERARRAEGARPGERRPSPLHLGENIRGGPGGRQPPAEAPSPRPVTPSAAPATDPQAEAAGPFRHADPAPLAELHLWPYRSLPRRGFVIFIGTTAALLGLPLLAVLGSPVLWGLLPFLAATVAGIWIALSRSYRDGEILEVLRFWPERVELLHLAPRQPLLRWEANPYWIEIRLHEKGGPVPAYLTLRGGGREVEVGRFLAAEERVALKTLLEETLATLARLSV